VQVRSRFLVPAQWKPNPSDSNPATYVGFRLLGKGEIVLGVASSDALCLIGCPSASGPNSRIVSDIRKRGSPAVSTR